MAQTWDEDQAEVIEPKGEGELDLRKMVIEALNCADGRVYANRYVPECSSYLAIKAVALAILLLVDEVKALRADLNGGKGGR